MSSKSSVVAPHAGALVETVSSIMRTLGMNITDTLDLKTKFADASKWLTDFATLAKNSGIKEAFNQMIPESIKTSIVAVAGAILGIAVPAMAMLAATTIAATYPLFLLGAAAALIAVALYRNWETVGPFFEALWTGIVNVFSWAWDVISTVVVAPHAGALVETSHKYEGRFR